MCYFNVIAVNTFSAFIKVYIIMDRKATENINESLLFSIQKKFSKTKIVFTAVCFVLLMIFVLAVAVLNQEPKPDPASEKIIRESVAIELGKEPNELTGEDLAKITSFGPEVYERDFYVTSGRRRINDIELADIKIFEKFTNLQELKLEHIRYPDKDIPKWMKILGSLGIIDLQERFALDLTPLEKLTNLQLLYIFDIPIKNIRPLAGLNSLISLQLYNTQISDLTPLKGLTNLKRLDLTDSSGFTNQQVEELQKALPNLEIRRPIQRSKK
jgi:hypothetical protein